jgi:hypothetical protein
MRLPSLFAIALSLVLIGGVGGCLDEVVPEHNPPAADGSATMTPTDGAAGSDSAVAGDGATQGDGGLAAFGAACTTNADCQSNICQPTNAGASMACTQMCASPGQNDPTCPGGGMCNMRGYCKT